MGQIPGWTGPVTSLPPVNAALSSDPSEPPLGKTPPPVCKLPAVLKVLCTPHKKGSGCGRRHGVVEGDSAMPLLVCTKRHHLPRSGNAHASSPPVLCFYLERIGSKTGSKWIQCLLFYRLHLKGSERCPRAPAGSPQKMRGSGRTSRRPGSHLQRGRSLARGQQGGGVGLFLRGFRAAFS